MRRRTALLPVAALLLTGCAEAGEEDTVTVFAAASLSAVFEEIGELYTEETGTEVELSFAGSTGLVEQLEHGAPADVLATADEQSMERAADSDLLAADAELFASNVLVIVTPAGNPAGVDSLEDLEGDAVETVLCAEAVPCGSASHRLIETEGLSVSPVSEETSVTDVLGRVRSGEANAGLVYTTDAQQAGDEVETVDIEGAEADPNLYPISLLQDAQSPEAGQEFVDFVLDSEDAQQILDDAGFGEPR